MYSAKDKKMHFAMSEIKYRFKRFKIQEGLLSENVKVYCQKM